LAEARGELESARRERFGWCENLALFA